MILPPLVRFLVLVFFLGFVTAATVSAREPWEDDLKRYGEAIELTAPTGYRLRPAPLAGAAVTGEIGGPTRIKVRAFVDDRDERFYATAESYERWIETGAGLVWISAGDSGTLPPMPRLISRNPAVDPNSGEDAIVELYEDDYAVLPSTHWPLTATDGNLATFPAAVLASKPGADGLWVVELQLFPNGDASLAPYPVADPSYRELDGGVPFTIQRLVSRPDRSSVRLELALDEAPSPFSPREIIRPGLVFLAAFQDGALVRLSLGGDAWTAEAPVSRLSAPLFRRGESLSFSFHATSLAGETTSSIIVTPDLVAGADYTQYSLIEKMGAPFDDSSPEEFQTGWTLHLESGLKTRLLAPLYDGRGAPGMLELEGLDLDPVPPAGGALVYSAAQLAVFSSLLPPAYPRGSAPEGWNSLLESKLGKIPDRQRGPETETEGF